MWLGRGDRRGMAGFKARAKQAEKKEQFKDEGWQPCPVTTTPGLCFIDFICSLSPLMCIIFVEKSYFYAITIQRGGMVLVKFQTKI